MNKQGGVKTGVRRKLIVRKRIIKKLKPIIVCKYYVYEQNEIKKRTY
jgi:hypothetical protein